MSSKRSAARLLGPRGPFASKLGSYEHREGQLAMATAVERALSEERVLICEAGTGTGKTLAYLLPALLSGKRVVVSTATKALQEQIAHKDLPLIENAIGGLPRVAVMKGLSNYVCRRRLREFETSVEALRPRYATALRVLGDWVGETESGEISELASLSEDDTVWSHVTSSTDTRVGAQCLYFNECFVTQMRREAEAARLIVVNHHLFFADLALRGPHPARVLPDYDAVVFDEAHQIEEIAGLFFGRRISRLRATRLVQDLRRALSTRLGAPLVDQLQLRTDAFWELLAHTAAPHGPRLTLEPDFWVGAVQEAFFSLDQALEAVLSALQNLRPEESSLRLELVELLARRTAAVRDQLAAIVEGSGETVTWLESKPAAISATPVDLAPIFQERVFASIPAVVLTSATLTTDASSARSAGDPSSSAFAYIRRRLGLVGEFEAEELSVDSPFDFERNTLLYLPKDLPPARAPRFLDEAAARVAELIAVTQGGAFVLTTSLSSMRRLHQLLGPLVGKRLLLVQGQAPKQALVSRFKAAGDGVLVATQGFWEGVDVPGQALRLVVLEKLPFAVPTDPIVRARSLAIERNGGNAFMELLVPGAAISLKQGFGRLIRTRHDSGIVALLDERVHTRPYSKRILRALPAARQAHELSQVVEFWKQATRT